MKKKHLLLLLRILVAVAGLVYIGYSVSWYDQVEVPKGKHPLRDAPPLDLDKAHSYRIVSGDFNPIAPSAPLRIQIEPGQTAEISPQRLGVGDDKFLLRPGIVTTLRHANLLYVFFGLLLVFPIYPIGAVRWHMLLRSRGMDVSLMRSFRLVMVGSFFNYAMPGSTGGDVVKAYYAAAQSARRADAVMSVVVDRIVGLLGLVLVAGTAGVLVWLHRGGVNSAGLEQCLRRAGDAAVYLWMGVGGVIALSAAYFSRRLRNRLRLEWLLNRLFPADSIVAKMDRAMVGYSKRKGTVAATVLMSIPLQFMLAASAALAGFALGIYMHLTTFILLIASVPILFLVAAVPISYQGFGLMEGMGFFLLAAPGVANTNQIVVMLLLTRLYQVFFSMFGAVFLLGGDIHLHPERTPGPLATQ